MQKRVLGLISFLMTYACLHSALRAQDVLPAPPLSSELGHQNLSRVAASAADIKAVLVKDAGLMVEIKRWLAKDATGHGQIISESDLNDDAIFDRLESDLQFRSVATTILQRYGYIVPTVNPNSRAAKEQDFLFQERTRLLAANQEEALAARRQRKMQRSQNPPSCDPQLDVDCNVSQTPGEEPVPALQGPQAFPPSEKPPRESRRPGTRRDDRENQMLLTEAEEESAGMFPQLPLGAAYLEGNGDAEDRLPAPVAGKRNLDDGFSAFGAGADWSNLLDGLSPSEMNPAGASGVGA